MACPQVVYGGDSPQIWRVAVNILNKQLPAKYGHPAWGMGVELTTPPNQTFYSLLKY
jgi:hypothetical protein